MASQYESLILGGMIEVLNGGYTQSQLPSCQGAMFALGGLAGLGPNTASSDWDLGTPLPVVDVLATLLIDGERPFGRRFSNRQMTLPIMIIAPANAPAGYVGTWDPLSTLAAAREALFDIIDQQTWTLTWTRPGGQPVYFDCFRAGQTQVSYQLETQDALVTQLLLSFPALPFCRSGNLNMLSFAAPLASQVAPPPPVVIDSFAAVSSSTQSAVWLAQGPGIVGSQSAFWDYSLSNRDEQAIYTHTLGSAVNISGLPTLAIWVGLASPENYTKFQKGNLNLSIVLNDQSGHSITVPITQFCYASNNDANPRWQLLTGTLPSSSTFDFTHVGSYSIQAWNFVSSLDHDLELWSDLFLNNFYASPTTAGSPATARGTVYQLLDVIGSARTPLACQVTQQSNPAPTVQTFSTPGAFQFIPPSGATSLLVQKWGAAGQGGARTTAGSGGGGMGGEFVQIGNFPCTPGVAINGYIGAGGSAGGGAAGFIQRVCSGALNQSSTNHWTTTVSAATTGSQTLIVTVAFGLGGGSVSNITDTQNNNYNPDYAATVTSGRGLEIWRCASATALGTSDSITVTLSANQSHGAVMICDEYVPLGNPDMTPVTATGSSVSTLAVSGTMTASDGVAIVAAVAEHENVSPNFSAGYTASGAAAQSTVAGVGMDLLSAYKQSPGAGSSTATYNWTGSYNATALIIGYPAAGGGGGSGNVNGQDTWFGANDATTAHGGYGVSPNTATGALGYVTQPSNSLTGQNTGFEGGNGTWIAVSNSSIANSSAQAHSGSDSLALTSTASGTMNAGSCPSASVFPSGGPSQAIPCSAGQFIAVSAWFRAAVSARTCTAQAQFYDNTGTSISSLTAPGVTDGTSGWVQSAGVVQAPAGAQAFRVIANVAATGAGAEVHYVDDVYGAVLGAILPNALTGQNTGFEGGNGTWISQSNATIANSSAQAHSGSDSLAVTSVAAGDAQAASCLAANILTQGMACVAGDAITTSAWFRAAVSPRTCEIGVLFYDINGNFLSQIFTAGVADTTTGWTQVLGVVTAPVNAAWCKTAPVVKATGAANEVHYIDDVYITDGVSWDGGAGATVSTTGGGGGSSAGTGANGNPGSGTAGGAAPTGGYAGGFGGAAAGNNPGTAGGTAAGGGGAESTGSTVAAGAGGGGYVSLAYSTGLSPYNTLILHLPGLDGPAELVNLVQVGGGADAPDGRQYALPQWAPNVNARFAGTYTVVLTNYSWSTPGSPSVITVTVTQYEYIGGPSVSQSVTRTLTPNSTSNPDQGFIANGIVVIDNITLPVRDIPTDNSSAYYTVSVTDSVSADRFLDVIFIDTDGQTVLISNSGSGVYSTYWLDQPDASADLGLLVGSAFDRSQAVSMMQYAIISGGPLTAEPGLNNMLTYAIEGQPALSVSYYDRYWVDDPFPSGV